MEENETTTEGTPVEEQETTVETVEEPVEEPVEVPEGADNPDAVQNLIRSERKKARDAYARARDLERQLAEQQEQSLPLEERISQAEARAQEAETKALRLEVALEKGIDPKLATRLTGTTKDELAADADELLSLMPKPVTPGLDGGVRETAAPQLAPEQAHNALVAAILASRGQQQ